MSQQGTDLETLKQSSRLVHYCATPLLFDPIFRKQIQEEQIVPPAVKVGRCPTEEVQDISLVSSLTWYSGVYINVFSLMFVCWN